MLKECIIILIFCLFASVCHARIARFYFSKAYECAGEADRFETPIYGNFIITFDTPVTLKIKDSQNKVHTFLIPTDNMDEDIMFIYDASEVKQLVRLLDAGHLRFSISGHLRMSNYNSAPTTYSFLDTIQTKGLVDAIQRYF